MYSSNECIRESLERNRKVVNKYLPHHLSNLKKNHLHKIRVAIKKINAICQLLEFLIPGNAACNKCYKKTRKTFKALGKLRDLQHNSSYFRNCHLQHVSQKAYAKFYAIEKHRVSQKIHKALNHFNPDSFNKSVKKVQKLARSIPTEEILIKARQFVIKKMKRVDSLLTLKNFKDPQKIHEVRKLLNLLKHILNSLYAFNISPRKSFPFKLKKMENTIGIWHDKRVLIHFTDTLIKTSQELQPVTLKPFYLIKKGLSVENRYDLIFRNIKQAFERSTS